MKIFIVYVWNDDFFANVFDSAWKTHEDAEIYVARLNEDTTRQYDPFIKEYELMEIVK